MEIRMTGVTIDSGEPTFEVHMEGSWMAGCASSLEHTLFIWAVDSKRKGDLKRMMDAAVSKFGMRHVMFTMVLNDNLKQVLKGFKEGKLWFEPCEEYMDTLEGDWECR